MELRQWTNDPDWPEAPDEMFLTAPGEWLSVFPVPSGWYWAWFMWGPDDQTEMIDPNGPIRGGPFDSKDEAKQAATNHPAVKRALAR